MSDDFFDDEQELMEAEAKGGTKASDAADDKKAAAAFDGKAEAEKGGAKAAKGARAAARAEKDAKAGSVRGSEGAADGGQRQAPPFWMVLAIAAIALILGVVIGYLIGTQATLAEISSASSQQASTGTTADSSGTSVELPEGHPQLSVDENGNAVVADGGSASAAQPTTQAQ